MKPHRMIKAGADHTMRLAVPEMRHHPDGHQGFVGDKGEQCAVGNRVISDIIAKLEPESEFGLIFARNEGFVEARRTNFDDRRVKNQAVTL